MSAQDEDMSDSSSSRSDFSELESDHAPTTTRATTALYEKDEDEDELERLVLGNNRGFRDNLFRDSALYNLGDDVQGKELELADPAAAGLEGIDDADLFMFDTGVTSQTLQPKTVADETKGAHGAAWDDSDDDRLAISLAGASRLRKLRISEAEDVVSGREYTRRLRQQYLRLNPLPSWATDAEGPPAKRRRRSSAASDSSNELGGDSDDEDVSAQPLETFLRDVKRLAGAGAVSKRRLRPEVIDIQRTREIPDRHKAPVESLSFHPEYPVLLSASTASIIYLHHIAPEAHPIPNPQLTSVQVKQVDVRRAEFQYPAGDKIFFAGRRRFLQSWDLSSGLVQKTARVTGHQLEHKTMERFRLSPCGRYLAVAASTKKGGGIVNIVSTGTMQWVAAARMSSRNGIADFAWWSTGDGLTILGRDGHVGEYSVAMRKFLGMWYDEGCIGGIVIALGGHGGQTALGEDQWVAVGSNSGITNIYERNGLLEKVTTEDVTIRERPTPTRVFEQLVTPVTFVTFSPDGQLMAFGSVHKKDALKLVHLPSCTVYRNWPTQQTPIGRVTALAFGRQSNLLAVGNDAGKIRLWEIRN